MTFRVGSVDYTVESVDGLDEKYRLFGQVTYKDTHIQLDAGLSPTRRNEVLVHELLHAIMFEAGITDQDEDLVNRTASVLAQVLRDNDFAFMRHSQEGVASALAYAKDMKGFADKCHQEADHETESIYLAEYSGVIKALQLIGVNTAKEAE